MNNTKTLAIVAVLIAATLVVGTLATTQSTQSAFAYPQKKRGQDDSKNGNTITEQKCKQDGSVSGFDNTAEQECQNVICTHPGNNATCSQEGVVTPITTTKTPPVTLNCEQCIRKFLNNDQINDLIRIAGPSNPTLGQVCDILHTGTQANIQALFVSILGRGSESVAAQIIQCLLDAGIVFATDTGG